MIKEGKIMELRNRLGQTEAEFLKSYDVSKYQRPSVTVDMAVFTLNEYQKLSVLLIKRSDHPFIGRWALPGGFVNIDEALHDAAARELLEETGVAGAELFQFGAFGAPDRDPRTRVISVGFLAVLPFERLKIAAGDDAAEAALFGVGISRGQTAKNEFKYTLDLSAGITSLSASVRVSLQGEIGRVAKQTEGDLASDHARLLFCALNGLKHLPRPYVLENICHPRHKTSARAAFDELFGLFPGFISV